MVDTTRHLMDNSQREIGYYSRERKSDYFVRGGVTLPPSSYRTQSLQRPSHRDSFSDNRRNISSVYHEKKGDERHRFKSKYHDEFIDGSPHQQLHHSQDRYYLENNLDGDENDENEDDLHHDMNLRKHRRLDEEGNEYREEYADWNGPSQNTRSKRERRQRTRRYVGVFDPLESLNRKREEETEETDIYENVGFASSSAAYLSNHMGPEHQLKKRKTPISIYRMEEIDDDFYDKYVNLNMDCEVEEVSEDQKLFYDNQPNSIIRMNEIIDDDDSNYATSHILSRTLKRKFQSMDRLSNSGGDNYSSIHDDHCDEVDELMGMTDKRTKSNASYSEIDALMSEHDVDIKNDEKLSTNHHIKTEDEKDDEMETDRKVKEDRIPFNSSVDPMDHDAQLRELHATFLALSAPHQNFVEDLKLYYTRSYIYTQSLQTQKLPKFNCSSCGETVIGSIRLTEHVLMKHFLPSSNDKKIKYIFDELKRKRISYLSHHLLLKFFEEYSNDVNEDGNEMNILFNSINDIKEKIEKHLDETYEVKLPQFFPVMPIKDVKLNDSMNLLRTCFCGLQFKSPLVRILHEDMMHSAEHLPLTKDLYNQLESKDLIDIPPLRSDCDEYYYVNTADRKDAYFYCRLCLNAPNLFTDKKVQLIYDRKVYGSDFHRFHGYHREELLIHLREYHKDSNRADYELKVRLNENCEPPPALYCCASCENPRMITPTATRRFYTPFYDDILYHWMLKHDNSPRLICLFCMKFTSPVSNVYRCGDAVNALLSHMVLQHWCRLPLEYSIDDQQFKKIKLMLIGTVKRVDRSIDIETGQIVKQLKLDLRRQQRKETFSQIIRKFTVDFKIDAWYSQVHMRVYSAILDSFSLDRRFKVGNRCEDLEENHEELRISVNNRNGVLEDSQLDMYSLYQLLNDEEKSHFLVEDDGTDQSTSQEFDTHVKQRRRERKSKAFQRSSIRTVADKQIEKLFVCIECNMDALNYDHIKYLFSCPYCKTNGYIRYRTRCLNAFTHHMRAHHLPRSHQSELSPRHYRELLDKNPNYVLSKTDNALIVNKSTKSSRWSTKKHCKYVETQPLIDYGVTLECGTCFYRNQTGSEMAAHMLNVCHSTNCNIVLDDDITCTEQNSSPNTLSKIDDKPMDME
ncbi:hypothetical protein SNEBB_003493 [Seison nebaliae]|nr:hypothetical protein SNEBB_003493 [Seison nebaliae]